MNELVEEWLALHHGYTRQSYENTIKQFGAAVKLSLPQIKSQHVRNWLDSLDCADTTKQKHLAILKAFFNYVVTLDAAPIKSSPLPRQFKVAVPRETLVERILTVDEVKALIEHEKDLRNHLILKTLYQTGVRVSELCGLRWKDLTPRPEIETAQLTVYGKRGKTRHITLKKELAIELIEFRGDAEAAVPIFTSATNNPLAPAHIHRIVKRAARKAELPQAEKVSPHWLRHAHACHSLNNGAGIDLLMKSLGHSSLAVTSRYLHVKPSECSSKFIDLD